MAGDRRSGSARRRTFWEAAIRHQRGSGRSVSEFCRQEGLSQASFYRWRRRLGGAEGAAIRGPFVSLGIVGLDEGSAQVEVVLDSPVRVRVGRGVDPATLREVLAAVAEACGRREARWPW